MRILARRPALAQSARMILALALPFAAPALGQSGAGEALELLASPVSADRHRGERWLSAHLDRSDFPDLARSIAEGGLEQRHRIVQALGSDDRHLGLAALCAAEATPEVRRAGEGAIEVMVSRWLGRNGLPGDARALGLPSDRLAGLLGEGGSELWSVDLAQGSLERVVQRLARTAGAAVRLSSGSGPLQLVVDPGLEASRRFPPRAEVRAGADPGGRFAGSLDRILGEIQLRFDVDWELFGAGGPQPWIRIGPRGSTGRAGAGELLSGWCRSVLVAPELELRGRAARSLASTGWPAALAWLQELWLDRDDPAALSGLMRAAGRGRIAPGLASAGAVRALLELADGDLGNEDHPWMRRADNAIRALRALPPVGAAGEDLAGAVAAEWRQADAGRRMLRMMALEGMGRAPADLRAELSRMSLGGGGEAPPPALRWQALRTLGRTGPPLGGSLGADAAVRLLEEAFQRGEPREAAVAALSRAGVGPPAAWDDPEVLPDAWGVGRRMTVLAWLLAAERGEAAIGWALALGAGRADRAAPLARLLEEETRQGRRDRVEDLLEALLERAAPEGAERLGILRIAALAGALEGPGRQELLDSLGDEPASAHDLAVLGALCAGSTGGPARERLLAAMDRALGGEADPDSLDTAWVVGFERAHLALLSQGEDAEAARLWIALGQGLRSARHPFARVVEGGVWPLAPGGQPRTVEELDWQLDPDWLEGL